jgi:queuine/archaeosine tRNA-ribosyltransferase
MGYRYIGLGGMVPLKSHEILDCLAAVNKVRHSETQFHLFGVTRCDHVERFADFGVVSFDSTSPLRQAFKHDRENYYTLDGTYSAIRVPQVEANASLKKRIVAGEVNQAEAVRLEQECLRTLNDYDQGKGPIKKVLTVLREYDRLHDGRKDRTNDYRATLEEQPWKSCPCSICKRLGIHVVLFRGAERNRRRGFHNVYVTYRRLQREITRKENTPTAKRRVHR